MIYIIILIFLILFLALLVLFSSGILFRSLAKVENRDTTKKNGEELIAGKRKVVALAAHPDDLEYWIGGTLGKLAGSGSDVYVIIATKNGKNGDIRKIEQQKAAKILGYKKVIFWDLPDGDLPNHKDELKNKLSAELGKISPEIIFTFDIEKEGLVYHHKDHETVGEISLEIANTQRPKHIYFYHTSAPDTLVDISDFIDKKIQAFDAHVSQKKPWISPLRQMFGDNQLTRTLKSYGKTIGANYAEPFRKGW